MAQECQSIDVFGFTKHQLYTVVMQAYTVVMYVYNALMINTLINT